jgi:YVTN family beta-propeller protein
MRNAVRGLLVVLLGAGLCQCATPPAANGSGEAGIGRQVDGTVVVPSEQLLRPAGRQVEFPGRPLDLRLLPDGHTLAVLDRLELRLLDTTAGRVMQSARLEGGSSVNGLAVSGDGHRLYASNARGQVQAYSLDAGGKLQPGAALKLPAGVGAGLLLSADERTLYAAGSTANTLVAFDLAGTAAPRAVPVGMAPFAVARARGKLYVSNWGGRRPQVGEPTAASAGSQVLVDTRTIGRDGSVTVLDEATLVRVAEITVGLLPSGLATSPDGSRLYVANANSDSVSVIDTATYRVVETIAVRPNAGLPFGSATNALCVSPDGARLFVAAGTNNAVAVVRLSRAASGAAAGPETSAVEGWIPTGWYPGGVALDAAGATLFVANTKGIGSLASPNRHNSHQHEGSVTIIPVPDAEQLSRDTVQTAANNRLNLALAGLEAPRPGVAPVAMPERHGEPSLLQHVIYIIRENRTYDQILGDMPQGDGDASLVMFGREVTPNAHALAEQFTLLDNFNCSGVLSADGHQWTDEAYVTTYLERMFGGFFRSYPFEGDDALAYAPSGFLWDNVLAHHKTFRDYGEMVQAHVSPKTAGHRADFRHIYDDFVANPRLDNYTVRATSQIKALRDNLCETTIGFPGSVPDVYRAGEFIRELKQFEATDNLPNLCILLLPCDHTAGTTPGMPTPRAAVADNDLALGRIVEAVSHSRFWPRTAIFVTEDDPQAGLDHVDGHRTVGFAISPYTPRGAVDRHCYTQIGMVKSIEMILGLPPMNQLDLAAEPMRACFAGPLDTRPYTCQPNRIPLDELNPQIHALSGAARKWALASLQQDFDDVDEADDDTLNHILWFACKGDVPYPSDPHPAG